VTYSNSEEIVKKVASILARKECCSCGTTKDLEYGPDPYGREIYNDTTPVWECEKCRYESAMDI